jgi:hypothetical protein
MRKRYGIDLGFVEEISLKRVLAHGFRSMQQMLEGALQKLEASGEGFDLLF